MQEGPYQPSSETTAAPPPPRVNRNCLPARPWAKTIANIGRGNVMDQILQELSEPSWWVSVVAVGILLNLGTAYLKPLLDRLIATFSRRYRERNQRIAKQIELRARRAALDPAFFQYLMYLELSSRFREIKFGIVMMGSMALALYGIGAGHELFAYSALGFSMVMFLYANQETTTAMRVRASLANVGRDMEVTATSSTEEG